MDKSLPSFSLGDIVTLNQRESLTVRAVIELPEKLGKIERFLLLGEFKLIIGLGADQGKIYQEIYTLTPKVPSGGRVLFEGASNYISPNLALTTGATGEVLFRVILTTEAFKPTIIFYRGSEPIVFNFKTNVNKIEIEHLIIPKKFTTKEVLNRYAALIDETDIKVSKPPKKKLFGGLFNL